MNVKQLIDFDVKHIWHPAAQMKDYETFRPELIVKAKGAYLYTAEGKEILDIISSWWCNLLGHCNEEISAAVAEQATELEHVIFANLTHPRAIELVQELLEIVPNGIRHFNFADNGSSAVEMALKIAFQYQLQNGHPEKCRFACLSEGYHGETIGALSVGSMDLYNKLYKPMMMNNLHIEAPDCFRCPYGQHRCSCSIPCIQKAERVFAEHHGELCALIAEPILQGAAGMRIYPASYLKALWDLCKSYDVLFIADEIATGFGRTGKMFACDHALVTPDIMTLSKGITGGYMPMSLVCTTDKVYESFYADYDEGKAFLHSHTYAGNPLACACALAVLRILRRDAVIEKASNTALWLTEKFHEYFAGLKYIGEIRHIGLIHAVELVQDPLSKTPFPKKLRLGYRIYQEALRNGLLLRSIGDVLYFNPPLNIERSDLQKGLNIMYKAIDKCIKELE